MSTFSFGRSKDPASSWNRQPLSRTRHAASRAANTVTRAAFESLESRQLLSTVGSGIPASIDITTAVARDSDLLSPAPGSVIVAGYQRDIPTPGNQTAVLARVLAGGSLDTAGFGTGGGISTSLQRINAIAFDSQHRIVVAGFDSIGAAVARYTPAGVLDTSFGGGVVHIGNFDDSASAVAIGANDQVAIGGSGGFGMNGRSLFFGEVAADGTGAVFNVMPLGTDATINSLVFSGTNVIAGGQSTGTDENFPVQTSFTLAEYDATANFVTSFDGDGIAVTPIGPNDSSVKALGLSGTSVIAIGTTTGQIGLVSYDLSNNGLATLISSDNPGLGSVTGGGVASGLIYVAGLLNNGTQLGSVRYVLVGSTATSDPSYDSNPVDSFTGVAVSPLVPIPGNDSVIVSYASVSPDGGVAQASVEDPQVVPDPNLAYGVNSPDGSADISGEVGFTVPGPTVVTASVSGGVLTVTGTGAGNSITVKRQLNGNYKIIADAQPAIIITDSILDPITTIVVHAGDGNDTVVIASSVTVPTFVLGEGGDDTLTTNGVRTDSLFGGDGNDTLTAGGGDDELFGGDGADLLNGGAGNDNLSGEAGNDTLNGGGGDDFLDGGEDDDVLNGGGGNDELHGRTGNDTITGDGGDDFVFGEEGNDVLFGSGGRDVFVGGDGDDSLSGGLGRDVLIGGLGSDTISGDAGDDILIAGETPSDTNLTDLASIRDTWNTADTYPNRVNALKAGLLNPSNLHNDSSADLLSGNAGRDWFIANSSVTGDGAMDVILGAASNETITDLTQS